MFSEDSYVRSVWYGERSLSEMFWFWNFLLSSILIGRLGGYVVMEIAKNIDSLFPILIFLVLFFPIQIWIWVGTWRSATNNPGFWAGLVKFLIVIGVLATIIIYGSLLTVPVDPSDL